MGTVSDSKLQRSFQRPAVKSLNVKSPYNKIKNLNQKQLNLSSTDLTRGTPVQENYTSNDNGVKASNLQKKNNLSFQYLNSNKIKSQHSLSSRFTHKTSNFQKQKNLKNSQSHAQDQFTNPESDASKNNQRYPFINDTYNFTLNSQKQNNYLNSPEFKIQMSESTALCRVSHSELNSMNSMASGKIKNLIDSLSNTQRLIKENKILRQKGHLMSTYMIELEKKLKLTSEICGKINDRFNKQDMICNEYKEALLCIMRRVMLISPVEGEVVIETIESEKIKDVVNHVNDLLSHKNISKFKSFMSHQTQMKEMVLSPPRERVHQRRASSVKSLTYKNIGTNKQSKDTLSPYNDSKYNQNEEKLLSLISQPNGKSQNDKLYNLKKKDNMRYDLRQSEITRGKKYERPSRKLVKKESSEKGKNLINRFKQDSYTGGSLEDFSNCTSEKTNDLFIDVMDSEKVSVTNSNSI